MLEAMACGLPIIMTPTGGAEELVHDDENGFIIRFADVSDIADKVERLIVNRDLAREMGKKSADIARSMSWENVANQYAEVYKGVKG
jgi:phosphatidylinositol alpha-1,6-mannosyltransferase